MGNHQEQEEPLSLRLGGAAALRATVSGTYQRVLADDKLKAFFEGMSMPALRAHQVRFFTAAFSGTGDLDAATVIMEKHRHLFESKGLDETHFDRFLKHIVDAMVSQELPQDAINEAITVLTPLRKVFEKGAYKYGKARKERRMPSHDRSSMASMASMASMSSTKGGRSVCSKSTKSTMKQSTGTASVCSQSSLHGSMTVKERRLAAFLGDMDDDVDCTTLPMKIKFKRSA